MTTVDEQLERRIVRYLDGELSPDEQLELDREMLRNPAAHRLLEQYRRLDELAATVLEAAVPEKETIVGPLMSRRVEPPRRAGLARFAWWLLPAAMAAALVLTVVNRRDFLPQPGPPVVDARQHELPKISPPIPSTSGGSGLYHRVSDTPPRRRVTRDVYRNVFGVVDEQGNIYWIEVDRTRTTKRGDPRRARKRWAGEL